LEWRRDVGGVHQEQSFETAIEVSLVSSGWQAGAPSNYRADLGLDTAELFAFIGDTQPKEWEKLLAYHGNDPNDAQRAFAQYLGKQIDERGVLDVLGMGVEDRGIPCAGTSAQLS
jgi:type I restriction enzyme R subunit